MYMWYEISFNLCAFINTNIINDKSLRENSRFSMRAILVDRLENLSINIKLKVILINLALKFICLFLGLLLLFANWKIIESIEFILYLSSNQQFHYFPFDLINLVICQNFCYQRKILFLRNPLFQISCFKQQIKSKYWKK